VPPIVIVLIVVGGLATLGVGATLVLGGLVWLGAQAEHDHVDDAGTAVVATATTASAAATASGLVEQDEPESAAQPAAKKTSTPSSTSSASAGGNWLCTASASVRVCGFANVCNYQMVFGNGSGKDRFLAQMQAKNACEGMARAKGSAAVCIVQCSLR
jgi:hypothetical protein